MEAGSQEPGNTPASYSPRVLDCSNQETAARSVSGILGLEREELERLVASAVIDSATSVVEDEMVSLVSAAGGRMPAEPLEVVFFHGTRTISPERYLAIGIVPLPQVIGFLWEDLRSLVPGVSDGDWKRLRDEIESGTAESCPGSAANYRLRVLESPDQTGGVWAYLIRDVALRPPAQSHDYLRMPEVVEDIATCAPADWRLAERFKAAAVPHLVHFRRVVEPHAYVAGALAFLWCSRHGGTTDDLTICAPSGAVPPESILVVEPITCPEDARD